MALTATPSSLTFASSSAAAQTFTVSGGVAPYSIKTAPNAAVATASINGATGVVTITPVAGGAGSTSIVVQDSTGGTPLTDTVNITVTALIVQVNTRIVSSELGCIQDDNAQYYDSTTGINLTRANPQSKDLGGFTALQLANVSNAVFSGRLTLVSGTLPAHTDTFLGKFSNFSEAGTPGGPGWSGVTGVSAAQPSQDGVVRSF